MHRLNRQTFIVVIKFLFVVGTMMLLAMPGGTMRPAHANGDTDTHFRFEHITWTQYESGPPVVGLPSSLISRLLILIRLGAAKGIGR